MTRLTRRGFLGASALTAAGLVAGCGSSDETSGSGGSSGGKASGALDWWDHFSSFQNLNDDWAATQSSALGKTVAHTYYDASKAQQAFQLAKQAILKRM